jgi:hypothetical protein
MDQEYNLINTQNQTAAIFLIISVETIGLSITKPVGIDASRNEWCAWLQ